MFEAFVIIGTIAAMISGSVVLSFLGDVRRHWEFGWFPTVPERCISLPVGSNPTLSNPV